MADSFKPRIPQWVDLRNPEPVDDVSFFEQRALELGTPLKKRLTSTKINSDEQENILSLANQIQELKIYSGTEVDVAKLSKNAAPGSYGDLASLALLNPGKNQIAERARRRSQQLKVSSVCEPAHASKTSSVSIKQGTVEKKPEKVILPPPKRQPFGNNLRTYSPPTGTTPRKTVTIPKPFPPSRRSASECRGIDPTAHLYPASKNPTPVKATRTSLLREQAHASKASQNEKAPIMPRRFSSITVEKKPEKVILPPPKRQPFGNMLRTYSPPTGTTPRKTVTIPKPFPPPRRSASHCRGIDPTAHLYPA